MADLPRKRRTLSNGARQVSHLAIVDYPHSEARSHLIRIEQPTRVGRLAILRVLRTANQEHRASAEIVFNEV
jgi:hypothetical protein